MRMAKVWLDLIGSSATRHLRRIHVHRGHLHDGLCFYLLHFTRRHQSRASVRCYSQLHEEHAKEHDTRSKQSGWTGQFHIKQLVSQVILNKIEVCCQVQNAVPAFKHPTYVSASAVLFNSDKHGRTVHLAF